MEVLILYDAEWVVAISLPSGASRVYVEISVIWTPKTMNENFLC